VGKNFIERKMADAERDLKCVEFEQPWTYIVRFNLLRIRIKSKVGYFKPDFTWNFGYEEDADFEKSEQVERNIMEAGTV
jgi:hypothetical protein